MATMLVVSDTSYDNNCYADSWATYHVTHDANNMTLKVEYNGGDQLLLSNGASKKYYAQW